MEVACCPEVTHAEILEQRPDAVAAVRAWLALIGETDPAVIAEVIDQCRRDATVHDYFTGRAAAELPKTGPFA